MKILNNISDLKPKFSNVIEKFFKKKENEDLLFENDMMPVPNVNITDEKDIYKVKLALPGLKKQDVKIEINDNCLIISSEKKQEKEEKNKNWMRKEYSYSSFRRVFEIPADAEAEQIKAKMKNGILTINISKNKNYISNAKVIEVQ